MSADRYEMPTWESVQLLEGSTIGRVCFVDDAFPLAFPVNFRLVHDDDGVIIVFRTGMGSSLARAGGAASFETDQIDECGHHAWSVIARGQLRRVTGAHDLPNPGPWLDERNQWMMLKVSAISGRRFVGQPAAERGFSVDWQMAEP